MSDTDTSMSAIQTYLRCEKQYEYSYVRGLKPIREATEKMDIGTLFHAGAAEGYVAWKALGHSDSWLTHANAAVDDTLRDGYNYHGDRRQLEITPENSALVREMLAYYWEQVGSHDSFEIIAVEQPFELRIGTLTVRNTFDLVVRENGRLVVIDHKTCGDVKASAEFLPLDFQVGAYMVAASRHFNEPVEFVYNMVRRAVPHELTKSGRKSTASKDPMDYVRRERLWKNQTELDLWYAELIADVTEMTEKVRARRHFKRSPSKSYFGCLGCPYRSVCSAELIGQNIPHDLLTMSYRVESAVA